MESPTAAAAAITAGGGRCLLMVDVEASRGAVVLLGMMAARIHVWGGELWLVVAMLLLEVVEVVVVVSASSSTAAKLILTSHLETGKPLAYAAVGSRGTL
jgi:hypothetical protein